MNIRDLNYFYQLSQLKSFTQVAKQYHVSQPTISYAIKRIEEYYQCSLIEKNSINRVVKLTKQGEILASHCKQLLNEFSLTYHDIARSLESKCAVGFPPIIINYLTAKYHDCSDFSFFKDIYPIRGGSITLWDELLSGKLDFSLLGSIDHLQHKNLIIKELFHEELFVLMSKSNPLSSKLELSFEDILQQPFILLDEHNVHLKAFDLLNERYDYQANIYFKSDDINLIKQMVSHNLGISLLTEMSTDDSDTSLVKIPFVKKDKLNFYISYAYPKINQLRPSVIQLMHFLDKLTDKKGYEC